MLIPPAKSKEKCSLDQLPGSLKSTPAEADDDDAQAATLASNEAPKYLSLFQAKRISGYWPVVHKKEGNVELTVSHVLMFKCLTNIAIRRFAFLSAIALR